MVIYYLCLCSISEKISPIYMFAQFINYVFLHKFTLKALVEQF